MFTRKSEGLLLFCATDREELS